MSESTAFDLVITYLVIFVCVVLIACLVSGKSRFTVSARYRKDLVK